MSELQSQKYRIEQMRQELNQFSCAANDALGKQYLNAATLQKLGIAVPPNKSVFWIIFILLAIFLSVVTQTVIPGIIASIYAVFKFVGELSKQEKALSNYFLGFLLIQGESDDDRFPIELISSYSLYELEDLHFGSYNNTHIKNTQYGDIIFSINQRGSDNSSKIGEVLCYVIMRKEGSMPMMVWDGSVHSCKGEIPPANRHIKVLALQFAQKIDLWREYWREKNAYEERRRTEDAFNIHRDLPQPSPATAHQEARRAAEQEAARQAREAEEEAARQAKEVEIAARWEKVHLPETLKQNIRQLGAAFAAGENSAAQGILLYGAPGTGKSLIARTLADTLDCGFIAINLHDVKGRYIGESGQKVKEVWEKAKAHHRCILFIDECESIFVKRGSSGSDSFTDDIVQAFIAEWDGFDKQQTVLVLGATNRRDIMDEAVLSRFAEQIEIPLPDAAMRQSIFAAELAALAWQGALPENASDYLQGFSGREIANLARQMVRQGGDINEATLAAATRDKRSNNNAVDKDATWDKLILNAETQKILHSACAVFANADALRAKGISIPRGILLYGPPGTGKTKIARTMANESGLSFIGAATADLKAAYIGQSGQLVKNLFERARSQSPCILFIDEMDIIAPARGGADDTFTKEIVGQLLQELDGIKRQSGDVFVLAATNRVDDLDSAVLSRFNRRIEIGLPDEAARAAIPRVLLASQPPALDLGAGCASLAARSDGQSGRDLRNWVDRAEQAAIVRHFETGDIDGLQLELADFD